MSLLYFYQTHLYQFLIHYNLLHYRSSVSKQKYTHILEITHDTHSVTLCLYLHLMQFACVRVDCSRSCYFFPPEGINKDGNLYESHNGRINNCCGVIMSRVSVQKNPVTTMLTYPWKCTVLHCNHLGNTWKPLVLMTRHFDYCPSASEGDNQSVRSSAPVVSRCFPGGYNVKLYISRGRLAWWLLAFLHSAWVLHMHDTVLSDQVVIIYYHAITSA